MTESARTSAGHDMATTSWLDAHYETAREEYENGLRGVGIMPGWHVLDAGCGGGNFLPLMSELIGPHGTIDAIDTAPENVAKVESVAAGLRGPTINAAVGSVLALPFDARAFDCIWCANVAQYLSTAEFEVMLAEFGRVLKEGGIVAVKDTDIAHLQMYPSDPDVMARSVAAFRRDYAKKGVLGTTCGTTLPGLLRKAGFEGVLGRGWLIERWAPLAPYAHTFFTQLLTYIASRLSDVGLSEADKRYWKEMSSAPSRILDDPDFCFRNVHVVVTGRKSSSA